MKSPLVSVIIPVFNAMPYLPEALSSVLEQDYPDIEVWIADDDSTDGSREFAEAKAASDSRVHVLRLPPKKPGERRTAAALNKGIECATGEFIAMMDADDWWDKHKISIQVAYLTAHPDLIACGTQARVKWEGQSFKKSTTVQLPLHHHELEIHLLRQSPFLQNAVMIRKESLDSHQLRYNETMSYAEDFEFFSRLIGFGKIANIDELLVTYRMHARQSIKHPDFSGYVSRTVMRNVKMLFDVSDEDARTHWHFVNHRSGYAPAELPSVAAWKNKLIHLNSLTGKFDERLFNRFVMRTWQRRLMFNRQYSPALLSTMLSEPYRQYLSDIPLYQRCIFMLKCLVSKKQ
jgi:glycosyltransferase involved in cell wall biosynthesis